jgi:large subunit ribosomal protein L18
MKPRKKLNIKRMRRTARVSARMSGTAERPRLVVNRSNRYLYAQLIDDAKGVTLAAISTAKAGTNATKSAQAFVAGEALAAKALAKGVKAAVFDRRAAKFHGRIKQFAEGVQKGGLKI